MLITFDDGTVAQITAADTVLGGIRNQLAVYAAKAVVLCNINPNDAVQAYAPDASRLRRRVHRGEDRDQGGLDLSPARRGLDDRLPAEMQDFVECVAFDREPLSGGPLARDVTAVIYGAYLSAAEGRRVDLRPYGVRS